MHVFLVKTEIYDAVFGCDYSQEWTQRLLALTKCDNGVSMEFTAEELADMEAKGNLTPYEREIAGQLKASIEADGGEPIYLECL